MASTTFIDNQTTIYAAWLNDVNNAVYNGIFQSSSITATAMVCTGTASGAGFTNLINNVFSAPGAIGSGTPNTGAFTTLSSTSLSTTSITGLTTPLSRAQGGTGLSAAGTAGNVLTSNGTNWVSSAVTALGVGQTWQNVGGSRAYGTTYTNSTGKAIMVQILAVTPSATQATCNFYVDGVAIGGFGMSQSGGIYNGGSFIVPAGSTYSVVVSNFVSQSWFELR
jgi:hypothetical protein